MNWLHCNICAKRQSPKGQHALNAMTCGHVFCQTCLSAEKCSICGASSPGSFKIGEGMKPEMRRLFQDNVLAAKELLHSLAFQRRHAQNLLELLERRKHLSDQALSQSQDRLDKLRERLYETECDRDSVRKQLKSLEVEIEGVRDKNDLDPGQVGLTLLPPDHPFDGFEFEGWTPGSPKQEFHIFDRSLNSTNFREPKFDNRNSYAAKGGESAAVDLIF